MSAADRSRCLTRVMLDDEGGVEVAQLRAVRQRIQHSLADIPREQREYVANALLTMAVSCLMRQEDG
jgi:hypothetical protein